MTKLLANKKGLIMGVANDHSIAWGIASKLFEHGAELAYTYESPVIEKRIRPLAEKTNSSLVLECDVTDSNQVKKTLDTIGSAFGHIDFIVHGIAYSDKNELKGRFLDTTRDNFLLTMDISCYSLIEVTKHAFPYMQNGGSILTLSYFGAEKVVPNYNVMGIAKAALEASVRYLATDLGPNNVRINAISAGPMRTLSGSAISDSRFTYRWTIHNSPLQRPVGLEEIGNSALYLLSDLGSAVTGEVHHVDCGYNTTSIPKLENFETLDSQNTKHKPE